MWKAFASAFLLTPSPVAASGSALRGAPRRPVERVPDIIGELPDTIYFDAVLRDFRADHPDFQSFDGHSKGLVASELGPDGKPVFQGGPQLSTKENFDQWYRDVPGVNRRVDYKLDLQKTDKGSYMHENSTFFPMDGQGWMDSALALDGNLHNFYFTLELHTTFFYQGGEEFTFRGDDDVWVFINNKLVMDLGGVHHPLAGTVAIDTLNITKGSGVELSFFFAERRCCGSEFRIETSIRPVTGFCTIWGDPHIDVFDNGLFGREKVDPVGIYRSGDHWLVKNDLVQIQGRYGTTQFTVGGQSALLALAVGGPFLLNHTLIIQPMDDGGKVFFDGQPILEAFPSEFVQKFMRVQFREGEKHIDDVLAGYPVKLIRAFLPRNVDLTINRWTKHLDAIIRMPQQPQGQDGHCGNFNLDVSDDTKAMILDRAASPVPEEDSLFLPTLQAVNATGEPQDVSLDDCDPQVRVLAQSLCQASIAAEGGEASGPALETCIFDVCFAGEEFAAEDAIIEHEAGLI